MPRCHVRTQSVCSIDGDGGEVSEGRSQSIPPARAALYGAPQGRMHLHLHLAPRLGPLLWAGGNSWLLHHGWRATHRDPIQPPGCSPALLARPACRRCAASQSTFARASGPHVAADAVALTETPKVQRTDCEVQRGEMRAHVARAVGFARVAKHVEESVKFPPVRITEHGSEAAHTLIAHRSACVEGRDFREHLPRTRRHELPA